MKSEPQVEAPNDPPRSPLEHALDRAVAAYARQMLVGERETPRFSARLDRDGDGAHVLVDVQAPDGVQHVRRRASAYIRLCADIWGRAQAPEDRNAWSSLVATISSYPSGSSNSWDAVYRLDVDMDWVSGLEGIAQALLDSGASSAREEAVLLLRRLYEVDNRYRSRESFYVRMSERLPPPSIVPELRALSKTMQEEGGKSSTPHAMLKRVVPFADAPEAVERLAVASGIEQALPHLSLSNHLTFHALVEAAMPALLRDGDGAVHELAVGIAQNLGMKLFYRGAYAEAKRLLDLVVEHQVALPESLRARWECRLYLDARAGAPDLDAAEEDWTRASVLDAPTDRSPIGRCMFWKGDVGDRRRVGLSRVAEGLALGAAGGDPCKDRKVTKKDLPTVDEKERILARAAVLSRRAIEDGAERVSHDLGHARTVGAVTERGFTSEQYAARAKVHEASGDLAAALVDFEAARELRIAAGLAWQIDFYGSDIRRLRLGLRGEGGPGMVPPSFDPGWFFDVSRTPEEREAAAAAWSAQPWRTFPKSPSKAQGRPFAYVLLRDVLAASASLWKLAAADGIDLGDRVAFGMRALAFLDAWFDRRDASSLEDVFGRSHEVAFFGEGCNLDAKSTKERAPLLAWLRQLVAADSLDETSVLRGLEGEPWNVLADRFSDRIHRYDPFRELFDALREAGVGVDDIAALLRAYSDLMHNDWEGFGKPRGAAAKWERHGVELTKVDASKAVPALMAWSRAYRKSIGGPFSAKWLWPLRYVGSVDDRAAFVTEVAAGRVDGGRALSKTQKAARKECLEWLAETSTALPTRKRPKTPKTRKSENA